jgi:hypothetical protein
MRNSKAGVAALLSEGARDIGEAVVQEVLTWPE